MKYKIGKDYFALDLDGHRVHPNPSRFIKEKESAFADSFSLINLDQINLVRCQVDLKETKIENSTLIFCESTIPRYN